MNKNLLQVEAHRLKQSDWSHDEQAPGIIVQLPRYFVLYIESFTTEGHKEVKLTI